MTITTKYNIGQEVFYICDKRVATMKVWGIKIEIEEGFDGQYVYPDKRKKKIVYYDFGNHNFVNEKDLFPTKEELLKSL